jgi:hypothetical protein
MKYPILFYFMFILLSSINGQVNPDTIKNPNNRKKGIVHKDYWDDQKVINRIYKNEIDPRQYVRVLYKKNPNYKEREKTEIQRIIWNWNDTGYFQKFKVIDNEGFLNIFFKKDSLAANFNFKGNISLEAYLKGKDGERKIEVAPYSLVGVERKAIGIESFAPTTVAQLLFNTIISIKRTIVSVDFEPYQQNMTDIANSIDDSIVFRQAFNALEAINNTNDTTIVVKNSYESAIQLINSRIDTVSDKISNFRKVLDALISDISYKKYKTIKTELNTYLTQLHKNIILKNGIGTKSIYGEMSFLLKDLELINKYLAAFEKAGTDAVQAFLTLASKDEINFNFLKKSLIDQESLLSKIVKTAEDRKTQSSLLTQENLNLALNIMKDLRVFAFIEGSRLDTLVNKYVLKGDVTKNAESIKFELEELNGRDVSKNSYSKYFKYYGKSRSKTDTTINYDPNNFSRYIRLRLLEKDKSFEVFKQELSVMAAEIIYRKLVFASIDLGKSGAQPGDILYLNVVWKNIDGTDPSDKNSSLLPIGKYYLRQTGWKTEIAESFYLVERFNEPPVADPNLSPSNFKGAYGASIMRTFYYNENFERTAGGRFLNWLQPSFGFNISYIDFYKNKDIEIGAALQLGLFKNVFFFGSGINLHGIRGVEKKSAAYFMFGVSFTNIAAKFKKTNHDDDSK